MMNHAGKFIICGALGVFVSGCSTPYSESQKLCISGLEYKLKSPSSLELVRVASMEQFFFPDEFEKQYGKQSEALAYAELAGKKGVWVRIDMIEYDASNSFGAILRDNEHCHSAPLVDGSRQDLVLDLSGDSVDIPQERIRVTGF